MRRRANDWSLICVSQLCYNGEGYFRQEPASHSLPPISIPGLRNRFSQDWRIYCKTRVALPSDSELRNSEDNRREIIATRTALLVMCKVLKDDR